MNYVAIDFSSRQMYKTFFDLQVIYLFIFKIIAQRDGVEPPLSHELTVLETALLANVSLLCWHGGIQTPNLLSRNQVRYSVAPHANSS